MKLNVRDLINIGVFTVIYIVLFFSIGMLGLFGPWVMLVSMPVSAILCGIVLVLLMARVPKFGTLTIVGVMTGLVMSSGHSFWVLPLAICSGIAADLINCGGDMKNPSFSPKRAPLAYMVFELWIVAPMLPMLYEREDYLAMVAKGYGAQYAEQMGALFSPAVIIGMDIVALALCYVGGVLGVRVLHKHFAPAGAVTGAQA